MSAWPAWNSMRDAKGYTARITWWITAPDLATARTRAAVVGPLLVSLSRANLQSGGGLIHHDPTPLQYGSSSIPYQNVSDRMVLTFIDAGGNRHTINIPAPAQTLFLDDGETVNPAQSDIAAATAAVIAQHCCSRAGLPFTEYISGKRVRGPMRRRINGYVRDPSLTIPA